VTDTTVLEAAYRVITRLGPRQFTLADIAREAGLASATLIQRFGSKRGLLLALAKVAAEGSTDCFPKMRAENRSPLKALFASFQETAQFAQTPEILANNPALLQMHLTVYGPAWRHTANCWRTPFARASSCAAIRRGWRG